MNVSRDAVDASYRYCRQMSCRAGSNFRAGFLLLPREQRRAMEALYAFMRHTDDLADDAKSQAVDDAKPQAVRRAALTEWLAALRQSLSGNVGMSQNVAQPPSAVQSVQEQPGAAVLLLPALSDAVRRFGIPHEHLYAVIDGVGMDFDRQRYETFDELRLYCERVASAVGLACIHIWGFRGPAALEPARQAGIALQLTNILRDLKEDAAVGRVYLPLADLRECGYSAADLSAGVDDARFRRLMAMEVARAEQFYAGGSELLDWLEPSGRRIFGLMTATYRTLLRKIARRPGEVLRGRVRLNSCEKLQISVRWWLLPPRKGALR